MDAIVFIILALVLTLRPKPVEATQRVSGNDITVSAEDTTREAKLNDSYYEDPNAFSEMINELGFPK